MLPTALSSCTLSATMRAFRILICQIVLATAAPLALARTVLIPIGSSGDVHPLLGLGVRLQQRGHDVTVITNPQFEPLVGSLELDFRPLGTVDDYHEISGNPDLWHPLRGFKLVARWGMLRTMEPIYDYLQELYEPGNTVVASQITAFGARIAHEKLGVPLATVNLQPAVLRSVYRTPTLPPMLTGRRTPRFLKRLQFYLADRLMADPVLASETNRFRAELELPPVRRLLDEWWSSPQRVICLFPDWYAPPQPDWPPQTVLCGFPLWDESDTLEVPREVAAFLNAGDPPLVFTPGSAMKHGAAFFRTAVEACQQLNRRGILLTRYPEQLPNNLPEDIVHFDYIPFSLVLPRAAALVHHGGIGSTAQALAAGIPQLIMPMAHDQFDNAARVQHLGVGAAVQRKEFLARSVVPALSTLLKSADVFENCGSIKAHFAEGDPLGAAALEIEKLVGQDGGRYPETVSSR